MLADGADAAPDLVDMCARYIQASASSSGGAGWASCHTAAEMCELVVGVLRQPVCSESELLDANLVRAAREEEKGYVHKHQVYTRVPRATC